MKSNMDMNARKRNGMRFVPPSTLRKTVTKRARSFHHVSPSTITRLGCNNSYGSPFHTPPGMDTALNPHHDVNTLSSGPPPPMQPNLDPFLDAAAEVDEQDAPEQAIDNDYPDPVTEKKNVRGKNKCKAVGRLKPGEKLPVIFFHNRVVGPNHKVFSRHLGRLVRDNSICPIRVYGWVDMGKHVEDHLWAAVLDKFTNPDLEDNKKHVFKQIRRLWTNYRSTLNRKYIQPCNSMRRALKNVPKGMDKDDWEWLVREHYWTDKFKTKSSRNSRNRANATMPCRLGSMPLTEFIYQMGGKDGNEPDVSKVFSESRKMGGKLEAEAAAKVDQIVQIEQANPGMKKIDVVEKSFGLQNRSHVVAYGGVITAKQLRSSKSKRIANMEERLRHSEEEKRALQAEKEVMAAEKEAMAADKAALEQRMETMEVTVGTELRILREMFLSQQGMSASQYVPQHVQNQSI